MSRIEYKDHIIQTYDAMLNEYGNLCHFIIDQDGNDIGEEWCLLEAILNIDKLSEGRM